MKVGGESGGFFGRVKEGWQQAGEVMNQPSQADKEAAERQARTDELRAILDQQKPVELNAERVARNVESFRRLSKNLSPAQIKQVADFNNPEVREAYEQWQGYANVASLDEQREKHNQDQETAA